MNRLSLQISLPLDMFELHVHFSTQKKVTGIFGHSGSGKTSLMEVIAGLRTNAKGIVQFGDQVWQDSEKKIFVKPEHRNIGFVPQSGLLFPHYTVLKNLTAGAKRFKGSTKEYQKTLEKVVALLELEDLLHRSVRMISGGERQRVALGRALCSAPSLIMMDEPLTALDQELRQKILPFLQQVRDEFDIPMIFISHDPHEIKTLCDDMIVLNKGEVTSIGQPQFVFSNLRRVQKQTSEKYILIPFSVISSTHASTELQLGSKHSKHLIYTRHHPQHMNHIQVLSSDILVMNSKPEVVTEQSVLRATVIDVQKRSENVVAIVDLESAIEPIEIPLPSGSGIATGSSVYLILQNYSFAYKTPKTSTSDFTTSSLQTKASALQV